MASNIQQLSEKRKKWIEANRENGFEDGIKRLLTDLYPDNAHFVYELLQNSEDAQATEVRFILKEDGIEFKHNGRRLFSIEDVDSITSIGDSTKKDDPTSIGKFGVGFKAVFAYTETPEIVSGQFHFRIRDLVVPDTEGLSPRAHGEKETRFIFPFDNPRKSSEKARAEIERNLRQLNESTLLFLSNIRKIEYRLPDSTFGFLERTEPDGNRIEISVQHPEDSVPAPAVFLRFEKVVNVNDEDGKPKSCRIAVAFSMEKTQEQDTEKAGKRGKQRPTAQWCVKPLDRGQVSIYFPADKETSNLRFHLHAPFASTVARDSIRDCSANNELRDHLANLIAESMVAIRDQGLLTVGFLATLPNDKDNLSSFYMPIQNSLINAFQNEKLTPMKKGGHAAANGIFIGPAQLSNLISDDDLAMIHGKHCSLPLWVANPPQRNQREYNFLSMLNIPEWTTENLVSVLSTQSEPIMKWLTQKSDEWHQQLYELLWNFLSSRSSFHYYETRLRIVRISDGTYSIGSKCYFPSSGVEHDDLMPRVAKGVYTSGENEDQQEKAKGFLEAVGVREVGEKEEVEAILKDRYSQEAIDRKSSKPDMKDIKRFITLVEKEPSQASMFKDYLIFKLSNGEWGKPGQVYLDSPFIETGLNAYYETLGEKSPCWALSQDYQECEISFEKVGEFARNVDARISLDIKPVEYDEISHFCRDFTIDYLDEIIKSKNLSISKLIWNTLAERESSSTTFDYLRRSVRKRKHYYDNGYSKIVTTLTRHQWIPQRLHQGDELIFVTPADADSKLLPDGFLFDNGWKWIHAVAFGSSIRQREESERLAAQTRTFEYQRDEEAAKRLGFGSPEEGEEAKELLNLKRKDPEGFKKWQESNKEKPSFPNKPIANQERRQERLAEQLTNAPEKEYEERDRSVRATRGTVDPNVWLRIQYTNETGQMICQICKEEMPFRKRDGEYYFEAVEAFSSDHFTREREAQFLALCPLCAAMYKEFVKLDKSAMNGLNHALMNSEQPEVSLQLGEIKTSIRFVKSHWQEMRTILQENV